MSQEFDKLDREVMEGASSPLSGLDSALKAGQILRQRRVSRHVSRELPAYLIVQSCWFMAFGLQMVLFPYLITIKLGLNGTQLGIANMALAAPSVIFLLIGGVVAERADGKRMLMLLHALAAFPALMLAFAVHENWLAYLLMVAYGVAMGTLGAFMMPARDSILNEVVDRRVRTGSGVTLQRGVAFATLAQFAAQIIGIIIGGYADKATKMPGFMGGFAIGPISSEHLLYFQAAIVAFGAVAALWLARGRRVLTGRTGLTAAFGDMADGFRTVRRNPKLLAMTASMFGVGIFVIGSFLVVLPIINKMVFNLGPDGIRDMYMTFWFGAFVSSAVLSVFKNIKRPGRFLLTAQFLGSMVILVMLWEGIKDYHQIFLAIVFIWGLAGGVSIAMSRSIVQAAAPKDQLARVLSIYQLGFMAGAPIGAFIMGIAVDVFGPHKIAVVPALGMGVIVLWMVFASPIWNLKAEEV
ncbi:MAG: MFS transporter [Ponticaulis sp.]|nr:MFS transporter [Ponticaulis sp.]|tara:strand:- start:2599 stop:3999 length:1401 start_codon:yes stop_codon:yes gene_type:complete